MSYGLTTFLGFDRDSCVAVFSIQGQKTLCVMVHTVGRNEEHGDEDLTQNNSLYFKQGRARQGVHIQEHRDTNPN